MQGLGVGRATAALQIAPVFGGSGVGEQGEEFLDPRDPVPVESLGHCSGPFLLDLGLQRAILGLNPSCRMLVVPTMVTTMFTQP